MKKINLTPWERSKLVNLITVINITRAEQCDLVKLRKFLRLLEILELTEEEKTLIGWVTIGTEGRATWSKTDHEFKLSFEDADYTLLLETFTAFDGWSPAEGRFADALGKKFGV